MVPIGYFSTSRRALVTSWPDMPWLLERARMLSNSLICSSSIAMK